LEAASGTEILRSSPPLHCNPDHPLAGGSGESAVFKGAAFFHSTWEKMLLETGLFGMSRNSINAVPQQSPFDSELSHASMQALRRKVAPSSFFDARVEYAKLLLP
jgi:hypothetical protein